MRARRSFPRATGRRCRGGYWRRLLQAERRLAAAGELQVDVGEQLGVEQGAVLLAHGPVDPEALAERIQARRRARILAARDDQRVHRPLRRDRGSFDALQLGVEEAEVEGRVVHHEPGIADEFQDRVRLLGEALLLREEVAGEPVHPLGAFRHVALGIEIALEAAARGDVVDELDRADLDDPVARRGVQAGGLGIEHDFTHHRSPQQV